MRKRKIALAGLGAAARQIHLPAYRRLPELEIVGGFDPGVQPGQQPLPLFSSLEEMLDKTRPDILAVLTPPAWHHALTRQGLEAGCHVFCEKPFMNSLEEAQDIIALSRAVGRWVVVNNQYRFMDIHRQASLAIGTPAFGDLVFVSIHQTFLVSPQSEAGWRGTESRRTCLEFGTHVLDLCRFFFGQEPISLSARMPRAQHPGGPDFLNLIQLEFPGDRVAHITLDRVCRGPHRYLMIRLDGTAGCIETQLGGKVEFRAGIRGGSRRPFVGLDVSLGGSARLFHGEKSRRIASEPMEVFARATRRLMQAFLRALEEGAEPPCHAEDNGRTLALMLAAYESEATRAPVRWSA